MKMTRHMHELLAQDMELSDQESGVARRLSNCDSTKGHCRINMHQGDVERPIFLAMVWRIPCRHFWKRDPIAFGKITLVTISELSKYISISSGPCC